MPKLTREDFIRIAEEMYAEGTYYSERYSQKQWIEHEWPQVDDVRIYKILDAYIRFLRISDNYDGKTKDRGPSGAGVLGQTPIRDWD
jgi:hypothetical protein